MANERKSSTVLTLDWPIDLGDGKEITKLTLRRPKGRTIKKIIVLIGAETIASVLGGLDTGNSASASIPVKEKLVSELAGLATMEKLDQLSEILGDLTGQPADVVDEIDPEDYPKLFEALSGFFPTLFSSGEDTPLT